MDVVHRTGSSRTDYLVRLGGCCGIGVMSDFQDKGDFLKAGYTKNGLKTAGIHDIVGWAAESTIPDCGIFVATFTPMKKSNKIAMEILEKEHTLLFKSEKYINHTLSANKEGKEDGVILCVFKYGKS